MPLPENCCCTLLITEYKDSLKEDMRLFAFWLLAFWMWEAFGREGWWRESAEEGK
jgi:hypothetical protein